MMLSLMPAAASAASDSGFDPGTYYNTVWDEGTSTVTGSSEAVPADAKLFSGAFEFAYDENTREPYGMWSQAI